MALDQKALIDGRTKYNKTMIAQALDYLDNYDADQKEVIPTVAGLAKRLKVHQKTLYEWKKHKGKKEIGYILEWLKTYQEVALVNGGLSGKHNSAIAKLILTGHHDYSETPSDQGLTITVDRGCTSIKKGKDTVRIEHEREEKAVSGRVIEQE